MGAAARSDVEQGRLSRLAALLGRARGGLARLEDAELSELLELYRYAASRVALHETREDDRGRLAAARALVARAHALLHRDVDRDERSLLRTVAGFFAAEVPRAIRAEWKLVLTMLALVYGLAALAYGAVMHDLELAWSLLDPGMVASEIQQLEATAAGEPFRGNFTFGRGESQMVSGWIMAHNIWVGILFFGTGLIPPLFLWILATNSLMLGTYTAVAAHWDQGAAISSILWCHGTLEIQAIVLAGCAGMVLLRAWVAPGPWSRAHAMRLESARAWRLMAAVFPLLVAAGFIEGFISPHAPLAIRMLVAVLTGTLLLAWVLLGGRGRAEGR